MMTIYEERAKQATLDAVKALVDEGKLTLEELFRHVGFRAPVSLAMAMSIAKNNPSSAA